MKMFKSLAKRLKKLATGLNCFFGEEFQKLARNEFACYSPTEFFTKLKEHTDSRDVAKKAMVEATAVREKEAATYNKFKADYDTNIAVLEATTIAIEMGSGAAFLKTNAANLIRGYARARATMADATRQELRAFVKL